MSTESAKRRGELSSFDDLPVHQHANVLARPASDRWNWTERWYFNVQRPTGELVALIGGGVFRNTGVTESYLCGIAGDRQINHLTTREVSDSALADGFVQFSIDEPMNSWTISAKSEELDTSVDLRFESKAAPFLFKPFWVGPDRDSDDYDQYEHFVQPGTFTGTVTLNGEQIHSGEALSYRDRTWGVRSRRPRLHNWIVTHFGDGSHLTLVHQEAADGRVIFSHGGLTRADGSEERYEVHEHDLEHDSVSRVPKRGSFTLRSPNGIRVLTLETKGEAIRGGTGAGYDANQGTKREGSGDVVFSTFDVTDPVVVERIGRGTIDTGAVVTLEGSEATRTGIGVWETALGRSHNRYGAQIDAV